MALPVAGRAEDHAATGACYVIRVGAPTPQERGLIGSRIEGHRRGKHLSPEDPNFILIFLELLTRKKDL